MPFMERLEDKMNARKSSASYPGIIAAVLFIFSCIFVAGTSTAIQKFTITVTQNSGGKITPAGKNNQVQVQQGKKAVFNIKPDKGYHVVDISTSAGSVIDQTQKTGKTYKYAISNVSANDTITATYAKDTYTLTVSITGSGTVSATGLTCGDNFTCTGTYSYGDTVALAAKAEVGASIKSWSGCKAGKTDKTSCSLTISKDQTVKATFKSVASAAASVAVKMKADFSSSSSSSSPFKAAAAAKLTSCPATQTATDSPDYAAGLDCDKDGGVIQYLTPQSFKIALKRLSFVKDNGDSVDFVSDQGTLSKSLVYDLSSPVTVSQMNISAGTYDSVQAEIYYYEIRMPINNPQVVQSIRVYLSDDDFPAEGNLGHHQGDITLIDENGNELGWVGVATPWVMSSLQTNKSSIERPGGFDAETGHQRGLFGDSTLWDQSAFKQGSNRDIFLITSPIGLTVSANLSSTVTFTFNVKDTWFWEDFDSDGHFNPCEKGAKDACAPNAEWAPIFNLPSLSVN